MSKYIETIFEKFIPPKKAILHKIEVLIDELLKKYEGGKKFFNALDDSLKLENNKDIILEMLKGKQNEYIVSTGGFGDKLYKMYKNGDFVCKGLLVFNGKILTKNKGVTYYYPSDFKIEDKEYVFLDDSLFSGKTFKTINEFLLKNKSSVKYIHVIYNGSKNIIKKKIYSFFNYY